MAIFSMAKQWRWRWGATHTAKWNGAPPTPFLDANASLQLFLFLLLRVDLRDLVILSHSYMHLMMWMDNY